jgi:hypothetical protein
MDKRLRPALFLLALIALSALVAGCDSGEPEIVAETVQIDLGDVPNGEIATRELAVSNVGDAVLVVESVATTCGCTSARLEPMQIAPGESATLHIAYDSGAHGPELRGSQLRQILIASNDPAQPELIVELSVNVTGSLTTESN